MFLARKKHKTLQWKRNWNESMHSPWSLLLTNVIAHDNSSPGLPHPTCDVCKAKSMMVIMWLGVEDRQPKIRPTNCHSVFVCAERQPGARAPVSTTYQIVKFAKRPTASETILSARRKNHTTTTDNRLFHFPTKKQRRQTKSGTSLLSIKASWLIQESVT